MMTDLDSRFEENHIPEPNSGCWLWLGAPNDKGYGVMEYRGKKIPAHRYSYQRNNGPISSETWVLHKCDNRICVNPDHLNPGNHMANMLDMSRRNRSLFGE